MRTTAAAAAVVGLSLILAAIALVVFVERSLTDEVYTAALNRGHAISAALANETGADTLAGDPEEEFIQVIAADGSVVQASPNMAEGPPIVLMLPGQRQTLEQVPFEEGPFLLVSLASSIANEPVTVIVGRDLDDVRDAVRAVAGPLAIGIPILVLLVGIVTWQVVGRALAPVESMRAEMESISNKELHRRVPNPPGSDEIARLSATMNRMLDRLESGQRLHRRFVSDASHELRSPVASIRQHAEVALAHPEATELRELAEVVLEEDLRLQRIVEDLLLLTRIDEGTLPLRSESVDLDDIVIEEAARLANLTPHRVDAGVVAPGRVLGDRERLRRMVRNLTDNAARHAHGSIALSLVKANGLVVMAVDDDGLGISEGHRDRVFERFVRLDEARNRDAGGAGLGLAIVREIATLHRGTAVVRQSPLGGARFEISLPSLEG